jgi:hypothetical protein
MLGTSNQNNQNEDMQKVNKLKLSPLRHAMCASIAVVGLLLCVTSAKSQVDFITIPTGTAPNEPSGSPGPYTLGQAFTVTGPGIVVTSLGAYDDDNPNSFPTAHPVQVGIFSASSGLLVTPEVSFTGAGSGTADGDVLFQAITPVRLAPGEYVIAASGYSGSGQGYEVFGNSAHGTPTWTFNSDGGILTLGSSLTLQSSSLTYPTKPDNSGTPPQYAAGDFQYQTAVPDGGLTIAMLGMAMSGLAFIRRKFQG